MSESTKIRGWAFALSLALIVATLLVMRINPFEISLTYLVLLAGVVVVGLMTNLWGGIAASAVSVFVIILINQYAGIYPRENRILNIASELAVFLLVGPLAGKMSGAVEAMQRQSNHWLERAEEQTIHDGTFGTIKPDWGKLRLEEETMRARQFGRPLAVALLQLTPCAENTASKPAAQRAERLGALQAVIRCASSATQPPTVVSYLGSDQVLVILPEHTAEQACQVVADVQALLGRAVYFTANIDAQQKAEGSLGKPFSGWGTLRAGVVSLDGALTGETLLALAKTELAGQPVLDESNL